MAMAEVYLPEFASDDHLTPFPRAPPPSPEMQPRSHSHVFEIPASKFEGIGLDLRRNTFPLDEEDESPLSAHHLSALGYSDGPRTVLRERDDDDDTAFPGSPQKRVCCSPCTLPSDLMTTSFPSSNHSLISSGFGSYQTPLHSPILEEDASSQDGIRKRSGLRSHSNSPLYFDSRPAHGQISPRLTAHGVGITGSNLQPRPSSDDTLLSRSYDLHSMHPHLPQSFETTQLPEVLPARSRARTLDSTSPSHDLAQPNFQTTLGASSYGGEEPNQRRRKVSVKRKNPEENDADPSLQFSFEYSYSSTGSSGESDWVMVNCKVEPSWPMEKKACCAEDPSLAISHFQDLGMPTLVSAAPIQGAAFSSFSDGHSVFVPPHLQQNPLDLPSSGSTGNSPFNNITPSSYFSGQQEVGLVGERVDTPTNGHGGPQSLDSVTMMDCGVRMDSLDLMDCEQFQANGVAINSNANKAPGSLFASTNPVDLPSRGVSSGHVIMEQQYQPLMYVEEQAPGGLVARVRARGTPVPSSSSALRRSCVDEYLQPVPTPEGQGFAASSGSGVNSDLESKLNISKSF